MPELAEVEIIRENVQRWLVGRRIAHVEVLDPALEADARARTGPWKQLDPRDCLPLGALVGRSVRSVRRRAKLLMIDLSEAEPQSKDATACLPATLVCHMRMTGKLVRLETGSTDRPGRRLKLTDERGAQVAFVDRRRLGFAALCPPEAAAAYLDGMGLGPEAWPEPIDPSWLLAELAPRRATIVTALLDQRLAAGVGNITAIEALGRAGVDPHRESRSLTPAEASAIAQGLVWHVERTLTLERADEVAYLSEGGVNHFLVYGREDEPCGRCGERIRRGRRSGRPIFWCPGCQR